MNNPKFRSEEQAALFEKLYLDYFTYVYKYEVGYPDDFNQDGEYSNCTDRERFLEDIQEAGMRIKVLDGY